MPTLESEWPVNAENGHFTASETEKGDWMCRGVLAAIVCGYEKSGTTLISGMLRDQPGLGAGFEGGLLLAASPRAFRRETFHYLLMGREWGLTAAELHEVTDTEDFEEGYRRLRELSPVIADKSVRLVDKTPAYMRELDQVLDRYPDTKCVVSVRDPRALFNSWAGVLTTHPGGEDSYINANFDYFVDRFTSYAQGYRRASAAHPRRVMLVKMEELTQSPAASFAGIFSFLSLNPLAGDPSVTS